MREYPRLRYGGARLANEGERGSDVAKRALAGLGGAALLWLPFGALLWPLRRRAPQVPSASRPASISRSRTAGAAGRVSSASMHRSWCQPLK